MVPLGQCTAPDGDYPATNYRQRNSSLLRDETTRPGVENACIVL